MRKGRLLLADNHQNMLAGVRDLLKSKFESVFMVADEASLIEAAEKLGPDITVADLSLPATKGINIARSLKKVFSKIRLIILSVHDERTAVNECLEAGAAGFVLKRIVVNDLVPAIETVLKGEIYVSPLALLGTETAGKNAKRGRRR